MTEVDQMVKDVVEKVSLLLRTRGVLFSKVSLARVVAEVLGERKDLVDCYELGIISRTEVASATAEHIASEVLVDGERGAEFAEIVQAVLDSLAEHYPDELHPLV